MWKELAAIALTSAAAFGCPADCDQDGELTVLDFVCFQNLFLSGDDAADMNGDGILNILDFVAYQAAFEAGCPTTVKVIATGFVYDPDNTFAPPMILNLWDKTNEDVLQLDDMILEYRGIPVASGADLDLIVSELPDVAEGDEIEMVVLRGDEVVTVTPVAFAAAVAGSDDDLELKEISFADRICEKVTVQEKSFCRCEDAFVTECTIQIWRKADEDGKKIVVRVACSDSNFNECDVEAKLKGK